MLGNVTNDSDFIFRGRLDDIRSTYIKNLEMYFEYSDSGKPSDIDSSVSYWKCICSFEKELRNLCEAKGYLMKTSSVSHSNQKLLEQMNCNEHKFLSNEHIRNYELIKKDGGLYPMTYNFVLESYKPCPDGDADAGFNFFEFVWDHIPLWNFKMLLNILDKVLSYDVSEYQKEIDAYVVKYKRSEKIRNVTENVLQQLLKQLSSELGCTYNVISLMDSCSIEVTFENDMKLYFELDYENFVSEKKKIIDLITLSHKISSYGFRKTSLSKSA